MTEQEKHLLLTDLCARLPYNVRIRHYVNDIDFYSNPLMTYDIDQLENNKAIIKPYLRPMSSMTEEEQTQLGRLLGAASYNILKGDYSYLKELLEYVYKNHIDLFGLIPMGLALEAPKEMYNT